jgi:TolA-binding protein
MTVVGIHPEELFDKLQAGELSPAEAERLRSHLERCEVCRFEYAARLDFQAEALDLGAMPPPALPLRPLSSTPSERQVQSPRGAAPAPRRRARRTLLVVGLAAAALISASAALAASVTGRAPWRALGALFAEPSGSAVATSPSRPEKRLKPAAPAVATAAPPVAASPEPSETAPQKAEAPWRLEVTRRAPVSAPRAPAGAERRSADSFIDEAPPKESLSATKLFSDANQARRTGDVGRATSLYHLLQEQYPASPEASLSRVTLALLQLDSGDAQAALAGFERYLSGSSRGLEAEALVGRARALGRLGRRDAEVSAWREVQRRYPSSVYGRQATERLSVLGHP